MEFTIDSNLKIIKDVEGARKVIEKITEDNTLRIEIESGEIAEFAYSRESQSTFSSGIAIAYLNSSSTPFNTIPNLYDKETASRLLYANRRAYNKKFK